MENLLETIPPPVQHAGGGRPSIRWVSAVIRPEKVDVLKEALGKLNLVGGITLTDVRGFGRQRGAIEHYKGISFMPRFLHKVKVDMVVSSEDVPQVLTLMGQLAQTGNVGDGKIFVHSVMVAMRIRTGERGVAAL